MGGQGSSHGGMGSTKHGKSGRAGKSPNFRHWMKRLAESINVKRRGITNPVSSVRELFHGKKK